MAKKTFFTTYDTSSLPAVTPRCEHFNDCGGCKFQHISYDGQIQMKKDFLKNIFGYDILIHCSNEYEYRNRMDFVYHDKSLCLRKKFDVFIPITTCHLIPLAFQKAFSKVQTLLKKYDFESYDQETHTGFLRYITFRFAQNQLMIICTTTSKNSDFEAFLHELQPLATSLYWLVSDSLTDLSVPDVKPHLVLGSESIEDEVAGVKLSYGPKSFFQSNTALASKAINAMSAFVSGNTVDVCCGVGTIALACEHKSRTMLGLEIVPEAIEYAKHNALSNNSKADFIVADMKRLKDYAPLEVDTVIVDPPRPGLTKKPVKRMLELGANTIVYLSCNPKTQKLDLDLINELDPSYTVVFHEAYDFFPQTPHVESLVVLRRS